MVLAVACAAFALIQIPVIKGVDPIVIAGIVKPGRCRVPILLSGQSELFLIDTGIEKSYVRADVKQKALKSDSKAVLTLGSVSIPLSTIPSQQSTVYQEFPPIGGIIGMDILSKVIFSIDYDKQEVTIWPEAAPGKELGAGFFKKDDEIASIPLLKDTGYLAPFIMTSLGEAVLDTGAVTSLLGKRATSSTDVLATSLSRPMEFFEMSAGKATQVVVRNLSLSGHEIFCQPMLLSDTTDVAVISAGLLGRRVLFDLPHKRVEYAVPSEIDRACSAIGSLLHGTVEEKKGELFLRAQSARNLGATKTPSVRIISIDGRKTGEWLAMFRKRDPATADLLRGAYDSLSKNGKVMVEHNGKPEALLLAPFLNP